MCPSRSVILQLQPAGQLAVGVVVLDVVLQQGTLPEGLGTARGLAFEWVVVQLNGEDGGRLVLYHSIQWFSTVFVGGWQLDLMLRFSFSVWRALGTSLGYRCVGGAKAWMGGA